MNAFDQYPKVNTEIHQDNIYDPVARIVVFGIGGAGNNAVNRMIQDGVRGVEYVGVNTDKQDLRHCKASRQVTIGEKITGGRGAGAIPEIGESAANESKEDIRKVLRETETQKKADMVFITCGMGGGTGTGAAPIIAGLAKEEGILTVGVVTKPFRFEGTRRMQRALVGIEKLRPNCDTLIQIANEKLIKLVDVKDGFKEAFAKADEILKHSIKGITDLINLPSLVNLDFADVATVMRQKGLAHIAVGIGTGENKAVQAISKAIESPLLDTTVDGATDLIISFAGDVSLVDVDNAIKEIEPKLSPDVNIIFGAREDANLKDTVEVTLIATGIRDVHNSFGFNQNANQGINQNINPGFGYNGYNNFANKQAPTISPEIQSAMKFPEVNMQKEDENISSLFFNPKKKETTETKSIIKENRHEGLNVDLSKIGFKKDKIGKDLLPRFITDNIK